jgi:lipopolysaccharide export system protein LptA
VRRLALLSLLALLSAGAGAETFVFSADRVQSVLATGKEKTILQGRAMVKSESLLINADRIELSGKDFSIIECRGSVVAVDDQEGLRIATPYLRYDRTKKTSHMDGPTVLEDRKNKVVLKAQWIENDGEKELLVAQVNVRILKENLACRSEYAIFRRSDKVLELSGAPSAVKKGDEYRATRIVINTDTEEVRLEGEVQGTIAATTEDKKAEAAP